MSINEINAEAKESLRKYFKNSQDVKHENEARKELTKEEIFESVVGEIKESEMKLEQRNQMRNTLQQDAKEALKKYVERNLSKRSRTYDIRRNAKRIKRKYKTSNGICQFIKTKYNECKSIELRKKFFFLHLLDIFLT